MAETTLEKPPLVDRVRLTADADFSDDLGSFGEEVPPRPGEIAAGCQEKVEYCLRRLLVAWRRAGLLTFPLVVRGPRYRIGSPPADAQRSLFTIAPGPTGREQALVVVEAQNGGADDLAVAIGQACLGADLAHAPGPVDLLVHVPGRASTSLIDEPAGEEKPIVKLRQRVATLPERLRTIRQVHLLEQSVVWLSVLDGETLRLDLSCDMDIDYSQWLKHQSQLAAAGQTLALDLRNLAEELDFVGISKVRKRDSHLRRLILHLLKWCYQPDKRSQSWVDTIGHARAEIREISETSPSLDLLSSRRQDPEQVLLKAYNGARDGAADETGMPLKNLPEECPFTLKQILDRGFWPEPAAGAGDDPPS